MSAPERAVRAVRLALAASLALVATGLVGVPAAPAGASCAITVSGTSPAVGFLAGGAATTITGCGFTQAGTLTVVFGAVNAAPVTVNTDASLTVPAPPAAGAGPVTVTVRLHPSMGADQTATTTYTYVAPPTISGIVPSRGAEKGGTGVTITGAHFSPVSGATTTAKFGATPATTVSGVTDTTVTAVSPAGTGTVNVAVTVTLPGGASATSNGVAFQYVPAPVVTSITPASGAPTGGQDVTLVGANFQPGAVVELGPSDGTTSLSVDNVATPVSVLDSAHIVATTPAGIPGATNVVVSNPDGQLGALKAASAGHYTYSGTPPAITTVAPASGTSLGATAFTLSGQGFLPGATVAFRATGEMNPPTATGVTVTAAQISGTTPAHPAGAVDVVVTNPGGGSATKAGGYTYNAAPAPTVTSVASGSSAAGGSLGGTQVMIGGTGFVVGARVSFGTAASPAAAVLNATSIFAIAAAHAAGVVNVTVTNPDGQAATKTSSFTYLAAPAPVIGSVTPATGPGGTQVTITGTGFANTNGTTKNAIAAAVVAVGAQPCTPTVNATCLVPLPASPPAAPPPVVVSDTTIMGLVPNAPGGAATVTVTNPDGRSATSTFTYSGPGGPPTLASISPTSGPSLGNTAVTLTGTGFVKGATVAFAGNAASMPSTVVQADNKTITAVTPAGNYGTVDVTVTNPGGLKVTLANAFTFTTSPRPTISSITPNSAPSGTHVTIVGTGFANTNGASTNATSPATVTIGGQALLPLPGSPAPPVVVSATMIQGVIPTASPGAVDVAVVNHDGQGALLVNGYTYPTDSTAPTTTATGLVNGAAYTFGTWARGPVTVTLTADDHGGSGPKNISFGATGAQPIAATTVAVQPPADNTFLSVASQGTTTLTFHSTDLAGNAEVPQTKTVMVDSVPPNLAATAATPASGGGTTAYASGSATNQNVTVTFTCADAAPGSGVATLTFTSSSGSTTTTSGTNPLQVTVSSVGTNQSVTGTCTDVAGNTNTATFSGINITRTSPSITVAATAGGQPYVAGTWTNKTVTVTFSCVPLSASDQIATLTPPVQVNGPVHNQAVPGTCVDTAGNTSVVTFGSATAGIDIDLTPPVATASATTTDNGGHVVAYAANTWTNHNVTVTFACTDPGPISSGVAGVAAPVTVTAEGDTSGVVGGCTDVAGNVANPPAFFGPVLIDKTAPSCTAAVNPNPIHPANHMLNSVTATVQVSDALSGPNGFVLVSVTSNNPATAGTDIVGFTPGTASTAGRLEAILGRVYTFTYQGFDVAGNASPPCTSQVHVTLTG